MTQVAAGHIVHKYDQELGNAHALVVAMGGQVLEQARKAVSALDKGDESLAREVVAGERAIDNFELEIDEAIFNLIIKHQPVAIDLRFILALSRITGNLERAGDQAAQIAWCVLQPMEQSEPLSSETFHYIHSLDHSARSLLKRSLDALAEIDVDLSVDVLAGSPRPDAGTASLREARRNGSRMDDEFETAMRYALTFALEDKRPVGQIVDLVSILRALTNIGDQAGNIAEQVIFVAAGEDVRYRNKQILVDTLRKQQES